MGTCGQARKRAVAGPGTTAWCRRWGARARTAGLMACGDTHTIQMIDRQAGKPPAPFRGEKAFINLAFSPDGKTPAGHDRQHGPAAAHWDVAAGQEPRGPGTPGTSSVCRSTPAGGSSPRPAGTAPRLWDAAAGQGSPQVRPACRPGLLRGVQPGRPPPGRRYGKWQSSRSGAAYCPEQDNSPIGRSHRTYKPHSFCFRRVTNIPTVSGEKPRFPASEDDRAFGEFPGNVDLSPVRGGIRSVLCVCRLSLVDDVGCHPDS